MTEYRIAELHRRFHIEQKTGKEWHDVRFENVPRYFDSLDDARSWVATIKRGVVYHDAEDAPKSLHSVWDEMDDDMLSANVPTGEVVGLLTHWRNKYTITRKDAPNLPVGECKAEDDTSIKPLEWFAERKDCMIENTECASPYLFYRLQESDGYRYSDPR
jgi:hypothetical protein